MCITVWYMSCGQEAQSSLPKCVCSTSMSVKYARRIASPDCPNISINNVDVDSDTKAII